MLIGEEAPGHTRHSSGLFSGRRRSRSGRRGHRRRTGRPSPVFSDVRAIRSARARTGRRVAGASAPGGGRGPDRKRRRTCRKAGMGSRIRARRARLLQPVRLFRAIGERIYVTLCGRVFHGPAARRAGFAGFIGPGHLCGRVRRAGRVTGPGAPPDCGRRSKTVPAKGGSGGLGLDLLALFGL